MREELDQVVDRLAGALGRSVIISDRSQRLLSYSAGEPDADPIRLRTILDRQSPTEMREFVRGLGIDRAKDVSHLPANRSLASLPRICVPVHRDDRVFGFIWLLDPTESISTEDLHAAAVSAGQVAEILQREELSRDHVRAREHELLNLLLSEESSMRAEGAALTKGSSVFQSDGSVQVVAVTPRDAASELGTTALDLADTARRLWPTRRSLTAVRNGSVLAVLSASGRDNAQVTELARALGSKQLLGMTERPAVSVGIGSVVPLSEGRQSLIQALRAADVAGKIGEFEGVAHWSDLGAYRILASVAPDDLGVDPLIGRLLAADKDLVMTTTLDVFLNAGGDVKRASSELFLHRTSLYARLRRVEELLDVNLRDGDTRLNLQLGLKLARLRGEL